MTTEPLFLDRKAAAKACSVSPELIDQAIREGSLRAKKRRSEKGGRNTKVLIAPEDLRAWVEGWDVA